MSANEKTLPHSVKPFKQEHQRYNLYENEKRETRNNTDEPHQRTTTNEQ